MLLTKTPLRISLGAGGIDRPSFYEKFGAEFATSAADKSTYVMVNRHPEKVVWMGVYRAERVDKPSQLHHNIVREVLNWMDLKQNIQVVSVSDVPPNSGMGSSSSFIVGLLNALHAYKGEYLWPEEIAKEATHVERVLLKEHGGLQDQYAASYGGILWIQVSKRGQVNVSRLRLSPDFLASLDEHLAFFYTRVQRDSEVIQARTQGIAESSDSVDALRRIQAGALEIRDSLKEEKIHDFGRLLDAHWRDKKRLSSSVSNKFLDRIHSIALRNGAIGGNLMGAGGGGHFMFVCESPKAKVKLLSKLTSLGLASVDMRLEMRGSSILRT